MRSYYLFKRYRLFTSLILFQIIFIWNCSSTSSEYRRAEKYYEKGDYIEAFYHYEMALRQTSSEKERSLIESDLHKVRKIIINNFLNTAEASCKKSDSVNLVSIEQAISILSRGLPFDGGDGRIKERLKEYKEERSIILSKINHLDEKATKLYKDKKYIDALAAYEKILKLNPEKQRARAKLIDISAELDFKRKRYIRNIEDFLKDGNVEIAIYFKKKLEEINPNSPSLKKINHEISLLQRKEHSKWVGNMSKKNQWFSAYMALKKSPSRATYEEMLQIQKAGSKYYYEKSIRNFMDGKIYLAYAQAVKARILDENDLGILKIYEQCKEELQKKFSNSDIFLESYDKPEKTYYQRSDSYIENNDQENALENLVTGFFYCEQRKIRNRYCKELQKLFYIFAE